MAVCDEQAQVQRAVDDVRDRVEGQVVLGQLQLGGAHGGRGSPTQERRLAALQDSQGVQHQPPTTHHGHAAAELAQGTVGAAPLHHA